MDGSFTLLLEVVVALEAGTETINGLTGLSNPESDGVYRFSKGSHLVLDETQLSCAAKTGKEGGRVTSETTLWQGKRGFFVNVVVFKPTPVFFCVEKIVLTTSFGNDNKY